MAGDLKIVGTARGAATVGDQDFLNLQQFGRAPRLSPWAPASRWMSRTGSPFGNHDRPGWHLTSSQSRRTARVSETPINSGHEINRD